MGYYFTTLGIIFLLILLWCLLSQLWLTVFGERVEGTIVDFDETLRHVGQAKKIYYHPVIEFTTIEGRRCVFKWGGGYTKKWGAIGDKIDVVYDANNPEKAKVNTFYGMWAGVGALGILGGGCLYAGIQLLLEAK